MSNEKPSNTKTPLNNNKESNKPEYDVNPLFLSHLVEMGFPENRVIKALVLTDNASAESAMNWLLEHGDDPDIDAPLTNKQINTQKSFTSPTANMYGIKKSTQNNRLNVLFLDFPTIIWSECTGMQVRDTN